MQMTCPERQSGNYSINNLIQVHLASKARQSQEQNEMETDVKTATVKLQQEQK